MRICVNNLKTCILLSFFFLPSSLCSLPLIRNVSVAMGVRVGVGQGGTESSKKFYKWAERRSYREKRETSIKKLTPQQEIENKLGRARGSWMTQVYSTPSLSLTVSVKLEHFKLQSGCKKLPMYHTIPRNWLRLEGKCKKVIQKVPAKGNLQLICNFLHLYIQKSSLFQLLPLLCKVLSY